MTETPEAKIARLEQRADDQRETLGRHERCLEDLDERVSAVENKLLRNQWVIVLIGVAANAAVGVIVVMLVRKLLGE